MLKRFYFSRNRDRCYLADTDPDKGTITIIYMVVGKSTALFKTLMVGDGFQDVIGPLGKATHLEKVGKVVCVGRNYAAHTIEMGHDPDREPPFFFQKNPDNLLVGGDFPYPPASDDVHFEFEMVAALKDGGTDIAVDDALNHVFGYAVALDMTRRDLQGEDRQQVRPEV